MLLKQYEVNESEYSKEKLESRDHGLFRNITVLNKEYKEVEYEVL